MAQVASSSSHESPKKSVAKALPKNALAIPDHLTGRLIIVAADGKLPSSPKELRAQIMRVLEFIKRQKWFFAHHRRQPELPPLASVVAEYPPCGRLRLMLPCVAFACQRLATAPADMHMAHMTWSWAEMVMERLTRGHVKKVQVLLQRRACSAVRCAFRASACVRCVFDACCRKRWLVLRCVVRIAAAASSAPRRSFLCAGCCCRPRCRQKRRHFGPGMCRRRRFGSLPCDC